MSTMPDEYLPGPDQGPLTMPSRRTVLGAAGATALGAALTVANAPAAEAAFASNPFASGVASGEPDSTSVVLWTRLAPKPHRLDMGMSGRADQINVTLRVRKVGGTWSAPTTLTARRSHGYTVKRVVTKLDPNTRYEYRFQHGTHTVSGVTRTLPGSASTATCRFAVLSCMSPGQRGGRMRYFHGLEHLHQRTGADAVDFVVHVGDYIYEFPLNDSDAADGAYAGVLTNLAQYRTRYGVVRQRTHARRMHAKLPLFAVPDDHEVWNDVAGGADNLGGLGGGRTLARYNAALRAWWENMPTRAALEVVGGQAEVRHPGSGSLGQRIRWGSVLDLLLVDTRLQRTNQGAGNASILGRTQREWLLPRIADRSRTWCALATSVPFAAISSNDKWSGYPEDRRAVGRRLRGRPNAIVLSGDIHKAAVVTPRAHIDGQQRVVATEFVGPPVTSASASRLSVGGDVKRAFNDRWGYMHCTVSTSAWVTRFCLTSDVVQASSRVNQTPGWRVPVGAAKGTANPL